jgi:anti-sigma factor RsiW
MTPLGCAAVRRQLMDYHDRELPVQEQIAVDAHLERCESCAAEALSLRAIGEVLRESASVMQPAPDDLAGLRAGVISRMRAEYEESWRARFERTFEDMHLVWIGLSSAVATVICVALALACIQFASPERDDSLAGIIAAMQSSNASFVRETGDGDEVGWAMESAMSEEEAVLALMTVVTRDGRLVDLRLVNDGRDRQQIEGLLNVISTARFAPARYVGSPMPTNVNVLWLFARTTVRGKVVS